MRLTKHKFNAKPKIVDDIRFDSTLESKYYQKLKMLQKSGEVVFFLRQTTFHLPGGTRLVVDFTVYWKDGTVTFDDVKGKITDVAKIKIREVEHHYPVEIRLITKV